MFTKITGYKVIRVGLLATIYAIVNDSKVGKSLLPIGKMDIAPSKRNVKAQELTVFGEVIDRGEFKSCKIARQVVINSFKSKINLDNAQSMQYNKDVTVTNNNKLSNGGNTMKTKTNAKSQTGAIITGKVASYSKTRDAIEALNVKMYDTFATVKSVSGEEYTVTRNDCTCKDHWFRGVDKLDIDGKVVTKGTVCRHRTAVADVLEKMRKSVKHW